MDNHIFILPMQGYNSTLAASEDGLRHHTTSSEPEQEYSEAVHPFYYIRGARLVLFLGGNLNKYVVC